MHVPICVVVYGMFTQCSISMPTFFPMPHKSVGVNNVQGAPPPKKKRSQFKNRLAYLKIFHFHPYFDQWFTILQKINYSEKINYKDFLFKYVKQGRNESQQDLKLREKYMDDNSDSFQMICS